MDSERHQASLRLHWVPRVSTRHQVICSHQRVYANDSTPLNRKRLPPTAAALTSLLPGTAGAVHHRFTARGGDKPSLTTCDQKDLSALSAAHSSSEVAVHELSGTAPTGSKLADRAELMGEMEGRQAYRGVPPGDASQIRQQQSGNLE